MKATERWRAAWLVAPALLALAAVLALGTPAPREAVLLLVCVLGLTGIIWRLQRYADGRRLRTLDGLLESLREGDYSVRGAVSGGNEEQARLMGRFNALAQRLQDEQRDSHESVQLLSKTLAALDGAVFAFEQDGRLRLINPAGERLLGRSASELLGQSADALGLAPLFAIPNGRIHPHAFPAQQGRWQIGHASLRSRSQAGRLLVLQPMERALRDEEAQAFRRLLRVLSHEINNSLAPIASMADTLARMLPAPGTSFDPEAHADLAGGLGLIEQRSLALQRFLGGYARLAKLPEPIPTIVMLAPLCERVRRLVDDRIRVDVDPELRVVADADQLEQVLINLLRNAVEAGGTAPVELAARSENEQVRVQVRDRGEGLPSSDSLFVPFFTTKAGGSGIGLVLSRQILEAQQGSLELLSRAPEAGTVAELRLPWAQADD